MSIIFPQIEVWRKILLVLDTRSAGFRTKLLEFARNSFNSLIQTLCIQISSIFVDGGIIVISFQDVRVVSLHSVGHHRLVSHTSNAAIVMWFLVRLRLRIGLESYLSEVRTGSENGVFLLKLDQLSVLEELFLSFLHEYILKTHNFIRFGVQS